MRGKKMGKIKREDEVVILAGKDKGKRGKVQKVLDNNKLLISGVNMMKKHTKPNPQAGVAGGIVEKEAPIQVSNVAIFNPETNKADRVGYKVDGDTKVRVFKSSGKAVDA
jgi:large subunit ribosomal protein L24